ncbi:hypothetical protein [Stutzerimonas frequens]|uniref:hypothetical protein n=1 Tax=Stutzerimonas frequens TaxID=2968969 RepID=UPI00190CE4BF|nr:hypothetical protein [Stutzerimonas frequens]
MATTVNFYEDDCPACQARKQTERVIDIFVADLMRDGGQARTILQSREAEEDEDG